MSLRLLIDEDSQDEELVRMLRIEGHDMLTVNEAGMRSRSDVALMALSRTTERVVLTRNVKDFRRLHQRNPEHAGILVCCAEHDRSKQMDNSDITRAMANLEAIGWPLVGELIVLNPWQFQRWVER